MAAASARRRDCLVAMPEVKTEGMRAANAGNLKQLGLVMESLALLGASHRATHPVPR